MTRIEERMIRAASDRVRGMTAVEAVEVLFREGLLSPRRCEQAAIRDEIARLERSGPPAAKPSTPRPKPSPAPTRRPGMHSTKPSNAEP